ncbi:hypothetical protein NL676_014628 [Syzygium grande]|nr:hypothetical protein NL676_014628 [Syzygium grande]
MSKANQSREDWLLGELSGDRQRWWPSQDGAGIGLQQLGRLLTGVEPEYGLPQLLLTDGRRPWIAWSSPKLAMRSCHPGDCLVLVLGWRNAWISWSGIGKRWAWPSVLACRELLNPDATELPWGFRRTCW